MFTREKNLEVAQGFHVVEDVKAEKGPAVEGLVKVSVNGKPSTFHSAANAGAVPLMMSECLFHDTQTSRPRGTSRALCVELSLLSGWLGIERKLSFSDTSRITPQCVWTVKLRLSSGLFNV